jgi:hypothetical protein
MTPNSAPKPWWRQGRRWGTFFGGVIMIGVFPLVPLGFELVFTHEIASDALMITASLYGLGVALTSRSPLTFSVFLLYTFAGAVFYGHAAPTSSSTGQVIGAVAGIRLSGTSAENVSLGQVFFWALIGPFVAIIGQRFLRHLRRGEPLFEFS